MKKLTIEDFIKYINNELGVDINGITGCHHVEELYKALLPYKNELKTGIYRLLSTDNYVDCYNDFSNKIASIDVPHWFDITIYSVSQKKDTIPR